MTQRPTWLALVALCGCPGGPEQSKSRPVAETTTKAVVPAARTESPAPVSAGSSLCPTLTFGSQFAPDVNLGSQTDADCYAWQEFIALNWPSSGGAFGTPGDTSEVQWQGFMNSHQVFQPNGAPPPPWGTPPAIDPACLEESGLTAAAARTVHPLINATKFSADELSRSDTAEAFPRGAPAWLGDVNGNNVWYEVRVNKAEYDTIVDKKFYDAAAQAAFYSSQPQPPAIPLQLPAGCAEGTPGCDAPGTGAVELKAAWMEVPNPSEARWNSYKLTNAVVVDAVTNKCQQVTVALVGLHIIHKTLSQPTWIWATFEHAANAPVAGVTGGTWNFNNAACAGVPVEVPEACQYNGQVQVTTTCTPNTAPQYDLGDGCPAATPTQVTRVNAIDTTAAAVNANVQAAVQSAFAGSVWQNYILVNVVWSSNPPLIPPACKLGPGCQVVTTPQLTQSLNPNSTAVANTVLETYIQDHSQSNPFQKSNCIICHQDASVHGTSYGSDFSFALGDAQSSTSVATGTAKLAVGRGRPAPRVRQIFH